MKIRSRIGHATALVAVGAIALTGCSSGGASSRGSDSSSTDPAWAAIEQAADQEGVVTWYSASQDSANAPVIEAFNEKYPNIRVDITRLISGELTNRYSSEKAAGAPSADVVLIADNVMLTQHPEWFLPLSTEVMPSLANISADAQSKLVGGGYVSTMGAPFTITTNTNLIPQQPTTWEDLVKPPWAGKGSLADPRSAASFMAAYQFFRDTYGDDYLQKLGASGSPFYKATATQAPLVAAGASGYLTPTVGDNTKALRDSGAPLKVNTVTPVLALTQNVGINSNAAHPNAARVFANFIASRDGQAAICSEEAQSLIYKDIPDCPYLDSSVAIVDYAKGQAESATILKLLGLS